MRRPFARLEEIQYLLGRRESTGLVFAEDHLPIDRDVEDSAVSDDRLNVLAEGVRQLGRQTGGLPRIASLNAELDGYSHRFDNSFQRIPAKSPGRRGHVQISDVQSPPG